MEFDVSFARTEEGWWRVEIKDARLPYPVQVRGKSIAQGRNRIRGQLGLIDKLKKEAQEATLTNQITLPREVAKVVRAYKNARQRIDKLKQELAPRQATAVKALRALDLSTRDIAEILGLSHQRVQQVLDTNGDSRKN